MQVERLVCPSTCNDVDKNWRLFLRLLLYGQFHNDISHVIRKTLFVVISFLSGHIDGLHIRTDIEQVTTNLFDSSTKCKGFQILLLNLELNIYA